VTPEAREHRHLAIELIDYHSRITEDLNVLTGHHLVIRAQKLEQSGQGQVLTFEAITHAFRTIHDTDIRDCKADHAPVFGACVV
jgi:hypothetical protein